MAGCSSGPRARTSWRSARPRMPGSPASLRARGETSASTRPSRARRCAWPPSSTTWAWPNGTSLLCPTRRPADPRSFMEMALEDHLRLWSAAPRKLLTQSRYAALLVSMHGAALYEHRDVSRLTPEDAAAVAAYLASERALQERLVALLDADRRRALPQPAAARRLGRPLTRSLPAVGPVRGARGAGDGDRCREPPPRALALDPWPFTGASSPCAARAAGSPGVTPPGADSSEPWRMRPRCHLCSG